MAFNCVPLCSILLLLPAPAFPQGSGPVTNLHYAPNGNFASDGSYLPAAFGFNLADVSTVSKLNSLPEGVEGIVFLGLCDGVNDAFTGAVQPFIGNPKVFAFYLIDEPDPTGKYKTLCTAASLKAESDWIHANVPGGKTFIVMMNLGTPTNPDFTGTYNPANTDIDYFGLDPAPIRQQFAGGADYNIINLAVAAAEAEGIPADIMVPVYQVFGGGDYTTYTVPTPAEEQQLLSTWASLIPSPPFDFAYSWGAQNGDQALSTTPDLQAVFLEHNRNDVPPFCCATLGDVVSAGLSAPPVRYAAPNAILSIFGGNLAPPGTNSVATADPATGSAPTNLSGVCVLFGTERAQMLLVTETQLNVVAPQLTTPANTNVEVVTNCDLPNQAISNPMTLSVEASAPEFFYAAHDANGGGPVAAVDGATGATLGDPARLGAGYSLAYPGELLSIYATGFGLDQSGVTVSIDGAPLDTSSIQSAGTVTGRPGLNQLSMVLPPDIAAGDHAIVVAIGGTSSPAGAYISVEAAAQ